MKTKLFLALALLLTATLSAQEAPKMVVACAYDYSKAIASGGNEINLNNLSEMYYLICSPQGPLEEKKTLKAALKAAFPPKNLMIYVHGDGANIVELYERGSGLPKLYEVNTLFFAWPSYEIDKNRIANYRVSRKNIALCMERFLQLIEEVQQYAQEENIQVSILFHSLGNNFAKKYAHYLINHPQQKVPFTHVVINAACVYAQDHQIWVDVLSEKTKNGVYVTYNENDKVLNAASLYIEKQALLGEKPLAEMSKRATYIDFTKALDYSENDNRFSNSHSYFLNEVPDENSRIRNIYKVLLNSEPPNFTKEKGFVKMSNQPLIYQMVKENE